MNVKPGWRTTEFWLVFFFQLISGAQQSGAFPETSHAAKILSMAIAGATLLGYGAGRTLVKVRGGSSDQR